MDRPEEEQGEGMVRVRLLVADAGVFHYDEVRVPAEAVSRHDRLIDVLREDPDVLRELHVDLGRLCTAQIVTD